MPTARQVRRSIIQCERCELSSRPGILPVPWSGPVDAAIAIVGEAPGEQENTARRPFVQAGASGRLLRKLCAANGIEVDDCFVCNAVSCWPGGTPTVGQQKACRRNLRRQLEISKARSVLILGAVALSYFDPDAYVTSERGTHWESGDRLFFVTVHPSYALRFPEGHGWLERDLEKFARLATARQEALS